MKKNLLILVFCLFLVACGPKVQPVIDQADEEKVPEQIHKKEQYAYKNNKYNFALKTLPKDFEIKDLGQDGGLFLKKYIPMEPGENYKDPDFSYTTEIYILPTENMQDYKDLIDFISKKYAGYTFRFADYDNVSGCYVDEGVALNAVSHFYAMSKNKNVIYDVYLKVPSKYYPTQKETLENLIKEMVLF